MSSLNKLPKYQITSYFLYFSSERSSRKLVFPIRNSLLVWPNVPSIIWNNVCTWSRKTVLCNVMVNICRRVGFDS